MLKKLVLPFIIILFLTGCAGSIDGDQYVDIQPQFDLKEYFTGKIKVWGIVQDRSGNIIRRFNADIVGSWQNNKGTLDEIFYYYDQPNKTEKRIWKITQLDDLNYEGTAGDIIGTATGKAYGNALNWHYEMDVPVDDTTYRLKFDDWIWAMRDNVIVNRSYLKKFGITFAEVTIFMQKQV